MTLTDAWRSEQDHVSFLLDEAERGEFSDERAVERGLKFEVELGQGLVHWVVGEAEAATRPPRLGGSNLDVEQALQDVGCRELLLERSVELSAEVLSLATYGAIDPSRHEK